MRRTRRRGGTDDGFFTVLYNKLNGTKELPPKEEFKEKCNEFIKNMIDYYKGKQEKNDKKLLDTANITVMEKEKLEEQKAALDETTRLVATTKVAIDAVFDPSLTPNTGMPGDYSAANQFDQSNKNFAANQFDQANQNFAGNQSFDQANQNVPAAGTGPFVDPVPAAGTGPFVDPGAAGIDAFGAGYGDAATGFTPEKPSFLAPTGGTRRFSRRRKRRSLRRFR